MVIATQPGSPGRCQPLKAALTSRAIKAGRGRKGLKYFEKMPR
jgi:hypothetical protein